MEFLLSLTNFSNKGLAESGGRAVEKPGLFPLEVSAANVKLGTNKSSPEISQTFLLRAPFSSSKRRIDKILRLIIFTSSKVSSDCSPAKTNNPFSIAEKTESSILTDAFVTLCITEIIYKK